MITIHTQIDSSPPVALPRDGYPKHELLETLLRPFASDYFPHTRAKIRVTYHECGSRVRVRVNGHIPDKNERPTPQRFVCSGRNLHGYAQTVLGTILKRSETSAA